MKIFIKSKYTKCINIILKLLIVDNFFLKKTLNNTYD